MLGDGAVDDPGAVGPIGEADTDGPEVPDRLQHRRLDVVADEDLGLVVAGAEPGRPRDPVDQLPARLERFGLRPGPP